MCLYNTTTTSPFFLCISTQCCILYLWRREILRSTSPQPPSTQANNALLGKYHSFLSEVKTSEIKEPAHRERESKGVSLRLTVLNKYILIVCLKMLKICPLPAGTIKWMERWMLFLAVKQFIFPLSTHWTQKKLSVHVCVSICSYFCGCSFRRNKLVEQK